MDDGGLYRLLAWLSPSYPVGAFSYSHGLEQAVEAGLVRDRPGLEAWLDDVLTHGAGASDGVFLARAHRAVAAADAAALRDVDELAAAWAPTAELGLETLAQGRAFVQATRQAWPCDVLDRLDHPDAPEPAYPVAVGAVAAAHGLALRPVLVAYLHAVAANLVSAGVRLVPLGQSDGQRATAALLPRVIAAADTALAAEPEEVGTAALMVDLCSMHHETQYTRLFRS